MAHDKPTQVGGTRTLLGEDSSGNKEARNIQVEAIGDERRVLTAVRSLSGSIQSSNVTVTTSATKLPSSPLTDRKVLCIKNSSIAVVFIGGSDVTTSNGYPLAAESVAAKDDGETIVIDLDDGTDVYGIVGTGSADVRILEIS